MLEANKRCNKYVCYCLLMSLLLGRKKGQSSRGKKPSEQFGGEKQEIRSSGRVEFQFRPDTELCVGHILCRDTRTDLSFLRVASVKAIVGALLSLARC